MLVNEMSEVFDLYYNNVTSNQAPGLNEWEKSWFLTKAEKEVVLDHFTPNSKGNNIGQGYDDSAKRQADFSMLMKTGTCTTPTGTLPVKIDSRSALYKFPTDVFIVINEALTTTTGSLQVIPLRYDEYTRLMSKPFKRPLKNQAWRLLNSGEVGGTSSAPTYTKYAEIITNAGVTISNYTVRYVRSPKPIIVADLSADSLTIDGLNTVTQCELDPILHEEIVQRAVELAKIAWTATGQDNTNAVLAAGQRSE